MKNFSRAWIEGSTNHKTSNIVDHANSDQHRAAKVRTRAEAAKATNQPITSSEPQAENLDESMSGPEATESEVFALHDWDEWFAPPSPASNVNSDSD